VYWKGENSVKNCAKVGSRWVLLGGQINRRGDDRSHTSEALSSTYFIRSRKMY
jgi:hypothetical protein